MVLMGQRLQLKGRGLHILLLYLRIVSLRMAMAMVPRSIFREAQVFSVIVLSEIIGMKVLIMLVAVVVSKAVDSTCKPATGMSLELKAGLPVF